MHKERYPDYSKITLGNSTLRSNPVTERVIEDPLGHLTPDQRDALEEWARNVWESVRNRQLDEPQA